MVTPGMRGIGSPSCRATGEVAADFESHRLVQSHGDTGVVHGRCHRSHTSSGDHGGYRWLTTNHLAPVSATPLPLAKTKMESLLWCAHHEMLHAGQIGLLRRQLGYAPLW